MLLNHGVELKQHSLGWMGRPLLQAVISLPDISKLSQHSARQCSQYDPRVTRSYTILKHNCLIYMYMFQQQHSTCISPQHVG